MYSSKPAKAPRKKSTKKKASPPPVPPPEPEDPPEDAKAPEPPIKKKSGAMSDKQKSDLKKHMDKLKEEGMSASEVKSHRMKMMVRMRKGMSVKDAHKDIGK